jgi:hypothetical protein
VGSGTVSSMPLHSVSMRWSSVGDDLGEERLVAQSPLRGLAVGVQGVRVGGQVEVGSEPDLGVRSSGLVGAQPLLDVSEVAGEPVLFLLEHRQCNRVRVVGLQEPELFIFDVPLDAEAQSISAEVVDPADVVVATDATESLVEALGSLPVALPEVVNLRDELPVQGSRYSRARRRRRSSAAWSSWRAVAW